ncbi:hypothetical protein [Psychroflexus aestuariivivens]|uniref:hypothetical protein n=1 Tax=Psychroflexus aestuariivivens TaxID=1795040 RepID=UPI000FD8DE41|nr:hypothetical protein [Psychroflexus aestuariivivens]
MPKFILFVLLLSLGFGFAQNQNSYDELKVDDTAFNPVEFDSELIEEFQNDSDYEYYRPVEVSPFQDFMDWLNMQYTKFMDWLFSDLEGASIWNYLGLIIKIISILGLVFLVVWLFNRFNPGQKLTKSSDSPEVDLTEEEELIYRKNLQELIQEAIQNQNYRLATRYYYLLILKNLKNKKLVDYQFQKTNTEYIQELKNQSFSKEFEAITRYYDFIWYGDFQLNESIFNKIKLQFEELNSSVKQQSKYE